jgi:hypothetical protein
VCKCVVHPSVVSARSSLVASAPSPSFRKDPERIQVNGGGGVFGLSLEQGPATQTPGSTTRIPKRGRQESRIRAWIFRSRLGMDLLGRMDGESTQTWKHECTLYREVVTKEKKSHRKSHTNIPALTICGRVMMDRMLRSCFFFPGYMLLCPGISDSCLCRSCNLPCRWNRPVETAQQEDWISRQPGRWVPVNDNTLPFAGNKRFGNVIRRPARF